MPRWTEIILIISAMAIAAAFLYGRHVGSTAAEARHAIEIAAAQGAAVRAADLASRKEADRLAAETARSNLALQLEDLAREEPVSNPVCLPLPRVLRLNGR